MYKTTIFTEEQVALARKIRAEEDKIPGNRDYGSDSRYTGKLGEWAIAEHYPIFLQHTQDFQAVKGDFLTPTRERLEAKTPVIKGDYEWKGYFAIAIDYDQYHENRYEILVYCPYDPARRKLTIVGWNYFIVFENHESKRFYKKYQMAYTYKEPPSESFVVKNRHGVYTWKAEILRPMEELVTIYEQSNSAFIRFLTQERIHRTGGGAL